MWRLCFPADKHVLYCIVHSELLLASWREKAVLPMGEDFRHVQRLTPTSVYVGVDYENGRAERLSPQCLQYKGGEHANDVHMHTAAPPTTTGIA